MQKGYALSFCAPEEIPMLEAVEAFIGGPINRVDIPKDDYRDIIDLSEEVKPDLKAVQKLIAENEAFLQQKRKKKK